MKAIFVQIKCELTKSFDVAAYLVDNFPETAEVVSHLRHLRSSGEIRAE